MIKRYNQEDIASIWEDASKFDYFLKVELANLEALSRLKIIKFKKKTAKINLNQIRKLEKIYKHEVVAFCYAISPKIDARNFHYGLTSSDVIDSATNLMIKDSLKIIMKELKKLLLKVKQLAVKYKNQLIMGRTHGVMAEPLLLSKKLMGHYQELLRRYNDLKDYFNKELTVQFSGAVGAYTINSRRVEKIAASILKMPVEPNSTQIIPRDRWAKLMAINSLLALAMERLALNFRLLHQSEINEVSFEFTKKQHGSSTMPHKSNPILAENINGLGRIVRSHLNIALENVLTWQERDLTQSSTERIYLPDNLNLICCMIRRTCELINSVKFNKKAMDQKIKDNYRTLSSKYLHLLIRHGWDRLEAYNFIQTAIKKSSNLEEFFKIINTSNKLAPK